MQTLLPYGKVSLKPGDVAGQFNPLPGTVTKTFSLLYSLLEPQDLEKNKTFASTLHEVVRAKYASGDYDFSTPEGFRKLENDSVRDAQVISMLRIAQQFFWTNSTSGWF